MSIKDEKRASEIADSRMQIIAPLLDPKLDKAGVQKLKQELCEEYQMSLRTLNRYLSAYSAGGYLALKPQGRANESKFKISDELLAAAIQLRREVPERSVPTIIQILELEGKAPPGFLKRTTLQDALARKGYSSSMMKVYRDTGYGSQRFQRAHRNDLWQGDIKYGPILRIDGKNVQTYLSCLIDDCTRYIIHAEFYDNMEQGIVEDTLKKGVMKSGIPRRLYFDNGSQYRTHWMKRACTLLGIRLLYAKPRNPQGKGKQERFNLTVDSFLAEVAVKPPTSIRELNTLFEAWLSECYHSKTHSALGTTPEIAFKSDSMPLRFPDTELMAQTFLHCVQRRVDKSGCISFSGRKYDVGLTYAGRNVDVVFDPVDITTITVESPDASPIRVQELQVGEHVKPKPKCERPERIPAESSRLLDAVTKSKQQGDARRKTAISYTAEIKKG